MQTAVDAHFLGAVHHRSADQRRLLNTRGFQGKSSHVGLEKGLNPCRGHTARKLLNNVLVKAVLMHHAALDLERRSRHGNDTRRVQRAQAIGNQPQGTTRADKCLVTRIAQTTKCIDNSLRRMDCIEVLIGHIVGIERRQRAVHVKKEHSGFGTRINHMSSFRG